MPKDQVIELDQLGYAIEDICREVEEICKKGARKAVNSGCKASVEHLHQNATGGRTPWSDRYRLGFSKTVKGSGYEVTGEVGNKAKPGLVHLLEKGHEMLGGGRTKAYPHMDPAFQEGAKAFDKAVKEITL